MLRISQSPDGIAFWIHVTPRSRRKRVKVRGEAEMLARRVEELAAAASAE